MLGVRIPVAREGLPFIALPAIAGVAAIVIGHGPWSTALGWVFLLLTLALVGFFRDPERTAAGSDRTLVSPADGRVLRLSVAADGRTELSIFLSPLDVHVNRSPMDGTLLSAEHRPGKFRPAYHAAAPSENEQLRLCIRGELGVVEMNEITGVLVRRIVLYPRPGDRLRRGQRIGIMKFGSRIDLVIPTVYRVLVRAGQRVRGAETVIAEAPGS